MTTVLPLSTFCTRILLFLRRIFNTWNFTLRKFLSRVLPVSLYDEKAEALSLLLINALTKLKTSKGLTPLYNSIKNSVVYILRRYCKIQYFTQYRFFSSVEDMNQKIKNCLIWIVRCNKVIRVIQDTFLTLVLPNLEMFLSFDTKNFVITCT